MNSKYDYTARARRFVAKHPVFNLVLSQATFWMTAYTLLAIIIHFAGRSFSSAYSLQMEGDIRPNIFLGLMTGALYGSALGLLEYFFDKQIFRNMALGKIIILKAFISLVLMIFSFYLLRFVLFDLIVVPTLYNKSNVIMSKSTWQNWFFIVLIYSFFMTLVINFILQVNKKFGPGILLPLLLGKYRNPKEEERIFMFMDLKSSTTIAESIGHLQYSRFIRDSFIDINRILYKYSAEIYQYVGDEVIISWRPNEGLENLACVHFFFACEKQFQDRSDYYLKNHGLVPQFKAGLHLGKVTAVEIGVIKRDIAYHGDTLNTTARIQGMCNEYDKKLLVSGHFFDVSKLNEPFETQEIGMTKLKGKAEPVLLWSVEGAFGR